MSKVTAKQHLPQAELLRPFLGEGRNENLESVVIPAQERPWLSQYDSGRPREIAPEHPDMLSMFRAAVARAPDRPAILYFDGRLSYAELDRLSDALASSLVQRGFGRGDRLAVYLQNIPAFPIALLGAWKAGGIAVAVNPMNRERELALLFADCSPRALVCHASLYEAVVARLPPNVAVPPLVLTASRLDFQNRNDPRLFAGAAPTSTAARDLMAELASQPAGPPRAQAYGASDVAMLVYTSGTTGVPKGAMLTHGNLSFNAQVYREWMQLGEGRAIAALAPLFHVTGLVAHVAAAFITASPMILSFRFHPAVMLDSMAEHAAAFTAGAITAFSALMHAPEARREHLASLEAIMSGGAPVPPALVAAFQEKFGHEIRNGYGLTETASPTHVTPLTRPARVDPASGALSIGVPVFNCDSWIAAEDGSPAPVGGVGEIVVAGPMISPGYWNKPQETAEAMRPDGFRTGDIGFMDADGWFYIVDRKKDMINAGGYKVWPREVEDVLYTHPAVREAAVVGVPDAYRGETVKAFVSLKPGASATPGDLAAWCKERMAAYKYPRAVEIRDDLPKTVTGKILRRMVR